MRVTLRVDHASEMVRAGQYASAAATWHTAAARNRIEKYIPRYDPPLGNKTVDAINMLFPGQLACILCYGIGVQDETHLAEKWLEECREEWRRYLQYLFYQFWGKATTQSTKARQTPTAKSEKERIAEEGDPWLFYIYDEDNNPTALTL